MDAFAIGVENVLHALDGVLGSAVYFPYVLLGVGCFFTIYLGFPQVRYFKRAWGVLLGHHTRPDAEGDTSHLQALSTALSGTVGTGNIGGVALAIFWGGGPSNSTPSTRSSLPGPMPTRIPRTSRTSTPT